MTTAPADLLPDDPLSPETLAWLADGVRHQILLRVLAVQRHDALGPLSVARMGLALLQRRLAGEAPDREAAQRKAREADEQIAQSVQSIAVLRRWDAPQPEARGAAELLQEAVQLQSLACSMQGHQLQLGDLAALDADTTWPAPDALYLLLGLLIHAVGDASGPTRFTLSAGQGGVVHCDCTPLTGDAAAPPPLPPAAWSRPLDARALG